MQDPHDPVAAIKEMRAQFVRGSERRLGVIESKIARLRAARSDREALRELRVEFHGFSGLGGTYGFPKVSKLGRDGEARCDRVAKSGSAGASDEDLSALEDAAAKIRESLGLTRDVSSPTVVAAFSDPARLEAVGHVLEMAGYSVRAIRPDQLASAAVADPPPDLIVCEAEPDSSAAGSVPWLVPASGADPGALLAAVGERLARSRSTGS